MNYVEMFQNMGSVEQSVSLITFLICAVLLIVANWAIFTKAGEKGWKTLIPFYNTYVLVRIADGNGWKFLLLLIPFVNVIYLIMLDIRLAKAFGKGTGFMLGLVLLPGIFRLILGFGKDRYIGPRGEAHRLGVPNN